MKFCKICACGEKVFFEGRMGFPDLCPNCQRRLMDVETFSEDDPRINEVAQDRNIIESSNDYTIEEFKLANATECKPIYALRLENGTEILLPKEGGIIGRAELGGDELSSFPSVSRKHMRIIIRGKNGVMVEDLSSYGTLINGRRMERNSFERIDIGTQITMCNVNAELIEKGVN